MRPILFVLDVYCRSPKNPCWKWQLPSYGELTRKYGELTRVPQKGGRVHGGSRYFEGVPQCFKILKIQKIDRPQIPRFHADPKLFKHVQYLFKHIFDLLRLTYVLRLSTIIQGLLMFHNPVFPFYLKRSRLAIVLDSPKHNC